MRTHVTVSDIGRQHNIPPRAVTDMFYKRVLDDARCPIIGGRRLIPVDYLPEVERALIAAGKIPAVPEVVAHAG